MRQELQVKVKIFPSLKVLSRKTETSFDEPDLYVQVAIRKHLIMFFYNSYPLHGPSMFAVKAKIYGVLYKQSCSIAFDETFSYWSAPITSVFLGLSVVATR